VKEETRVIYLEQSLAFIASMNYALLAFHSSGLTFNLTIVSSRGGLGVVLRGIDSPRPT